MPLKTIAAPQRMPALAVTEEPAVAERQPTGSGARDSAPPIRYPDGSSVEVRDRFEKEWTAGFEIAAVTPQGYRIRRVSDGSVLPTEFARHEVRKARRRTNWWV